MELIFDVDTALAEVPVNIFPLIDDTDFKTRETGVAYNASGMDLVWNFVTPGGTHTQTAVTPTTGGTYDWQHAGDGMYTIEIPASGGASINNDTEGFGWFTGIATGILPWRGPICLFRASGLNDLLIENAYSTTRGLSGTALPAAAAEASGGLPTLSAAQGSNGTINVNVHRWLTGTPNALQSGRVDSYLGAVANGVIAAASFASNALDAVWSTATRVLTAGTNIVLAKGTGVTGFTDLDAAGVRSAVGLSTANLDTQLSTIDTVVDAVKVTTDKVDDTLEDQGGGTYGFTEEALQEAPTGGSAPTVSEIADEVETRTIAAVTVVNGLANDVITSAAIASSAVTELQSGLATASALSTVSGKIDTVDDFLDTEVAAILAAVDTEVAAIKVKTDNLPQGVKKNTALSNFSFVMVDDGDHVTGATGLTVTAERSINGGSFGSCANSVSEVGNGVYKINLANTDLNGDFIVLKFTASGADDTLLSIKTES